MTPPKIPVDRTTVLVVDDEDGIRQALTRFLSRLGYHVQAASNASEALQRLAEHHPEAMLCDIRMPETSGVELLPKVLARDPDLAVLLLTALDEPRTADRKSTRLNSSHRTISYAVFCLKKKK